MELTTDLLNIISNGGVSIIIFTIWYVTYRTQTKQHAETVERLFNQIEQDLKYKEILIGILSRLEAKIDSKK